VNEDRPNLTSAIAIVTVLAISMGSIGALIAARHYRPTGEVISGPRLTSPTPSPSESPPLHLPGSAQVVAPSTGVVWVLMDYDALFRSTDQGNTWEKRSLPAPPGGIRLTVTFIDDHEGWLLGPGVPATQCEEAAADVWHTTDGAATWQHLNAAGIVRSQCKDGIWFVDAKHGFITASDPNHRPTIYRTSDGGGTWMASTLPDPPDFKSSAGGLVLNAQWTKAFGSTLYLEASNLQTDPATSRQYIFTSADGASWAWRQKVPPRSPVMVTETRLLLLSGPGGPQESTNGGQQWHPYQTDLVLDSSEFGGTQIVFADAQVGYETGGGALQRTNDGGAHWLRIQTPGAEPAVSPSPSPSPSGIPMPTTAELSAPSANVAWALVADAHLFHSADQGKTWNEVSWLKLQGGGAPLISFVDDTTGWALFGGVPATSCTSQGATLVQTNDGAGAWHATANAINAPSSLPFNQCKDAMYFQDAERGWLATGDTVSAPKIWRTTDGGLDWTSASLKDFRLTPPNGPASRVASLKSFGNIVLAFIPPYVYGSIDGGVSWAYITETRAASHSIGFVTSSRWIELISPDQSSETTDGGQTWHSLSTDYSQAAPIAPQVVFGDANIGYATVRGEIQRTADGGAHWEMIKNSWP
jgi:photosystem II stability/assembly factor-like uncharacterized protein